MPTRNEIDLVGKTMRILEVLASSEDNVSLKEIAARVNMVKSSAFRILYSLDYFVRAVETELKQV